MEKTDLFIETFLHTTIPTYCAVCLFLKTDPLLYSLQRCPRFTIHVFEFDINTADLYETQVNDGAGGVGR